MEHLSGLPRGAFTKIDAQEDEIFYEPPRGVYHIDERVLAALTQFYQTVLPKDRILLDPMSS